MTRDCAATIQQCDEFHHEGRLDIYPVLSYSLSIPRFTVRGGFRTKKGLAIIVDTTSAHSR